MKPARFLDEADYEMRIQALAYELKRPGLGQRFIARIERTVAFLREYPRAGAPLSRSPYRKMNVLGLPFRLVYAVTTKRIWIVAVAHHSRRFRYWRDRRLPDDKD